MDEPNGILMPPRRGRERRRKLRLVATALAVVLVLGGAAVWWFWIRGGGEPGASGPTAEAGRLAPLEARAPESRARVAEPPPEVPPLDRSDAFVRDLVAGLSERPAWASWLVTDGLARRFVASVVLVSAGETPAPRVDDMQRMEPDGGFRVTRSGDRTVIDPASYRRYDLHAATIASLDTAGVAGLYRQLRPLFEDAHRELGLGDRSFDDTLGRAIGVLLAVDVPDGPIEVEREDGVYVFSDPALESLPPAGKQLLRMGPENARLVQAKLRELAAAIGVDPDDSAGEGGPADP